MRLKSNEMNMFSAHLMLAFSQVRSLILTLNHDNANANIQLMNWLKHKLTHLIKQHHSHPNFGLAVHHEVQLMISTMEYNDIGWEERLR